MRILYGVQGTGNGHISRARMMAEHFRRRGIAVDYLFSGRAPERYFDMACFGDYRVRTGLSFVTRNGAVSNLHTLLQSHPLTAIREVLALDVSDYDLIITDFEPVTAWAGKLADKTVIGIGHQYAFRHPGVPHSRRYLMSRLVLRCFAPVTIGLGLHWSPFDAPIVPPIVNPQLQARGADKVLVYLPFEDQQRVSSLLRNFPNTAFVQYSPDLEDGELANLSLRKTSLDGFKRDLQSCKAVICNAGFELISECLHLGKPVLAKPVTGQGEQEANALALSQLNYAAVMRTLDAQRIDAWLNQLPRRAPVAYPDVAAALVDWILAGNWQDTQQLSTDLWNKTRLA